MQRYVPFAFSPGEPFRCPKCGNLHSIATRAIETRPKMLDSLDEVLEKEGLVPEGEILVVADDCTWEAAGNEVYKNLLKKRQVSSCILSSGDGPLYAEELWFPVLRERAEKKALLVSVGSGTITDLVKWAGNDQSIPVVAVPTAPSMNAYTSAILALFAGGVKKTATVLPPAGVFADSAVLAASPVEMIRAGFADSLAKSFANADWKMASVLLGEPYCPLPLEIVGIAEQLPLIPELLAKRDLSSIESLMKRLHLGGISMQVAGSSSPASGGEHLISHFLDMFAYETDRPVFALHGLQVGIGLLFSAFLYEKVRALCAQSLDPKVYSSNISDALSTLTKIFPSAKEDLLKECKKKEILISSMEEALKKKFSLLEESVLQNVPSFVESKDLLRRAGCPVSFKGIDVDREGALTALIYSRFIRARLTILDLAAGLGCLEEAAYEFLGGADE
jgi:glycerol-1-phosphate dehydrogenase [NAD(P)+]